MHVAWNTIAQIQSNPIQHTAKLRNDILDYCATYPNVGLRYHKSDIILHIDADASYLVAPYAKSRFTGLFQLTPNSSTHFNNVLILIVCKTLKYVATSSTECETAAVFHNAQRAIPICYILQQLGHPQPPTPITLDNSSTHNFYQKQ